MVLDNLNIYSVSGIKSTFSYKIEDTFFFFFFFHEKIDLGISKIALYILDTSCQLLGMKEFVVRSLRILALTEGEVNLITA